MGLNDTPSGERIHIGFFGRRNAGKSSVVNAITGQNLAVVSSQKGTTTDPVLKAMELLPLGPVMIIDTPGFDDEGTLGELRIQKTKQVLNQVDIAILVVDVLEGIKDCDRELIALFEKKGIAYLIVYNKCDQLSQWPEETANTFYVSALEQKNIYACKEKIGSLVDTGSSKLKLVGDLMKPNQRIVLVIPIDSAAPKGRLILPQQQVIRDILEGAGTALCVRETELKNLLENMKTPPDMVITDSQAFDRVSKEVPNTVLLTSFSILMARYKGLLGTAVKGVLAIENLKDGDKVLIAEGCTHHRQCDDIGSVKIPRWLKNYTGKELCIETCSGREFPEDLSAYALIIHCGGCMLKERVVKHRMNSALEQEIPITNYGIAIAYMQGILKRSIEIFPDLAEQIRE